MRLFGSSGIRRLADKSLIELTLKVGLAVGKIYGNVVVGCDTRTSSAALKHAFFSGLLGSGAKVYDAGTIPTPTLAIAARDFQVGAMITASHNPPEYNGIKLLNPDGSAFDARQREQIEDMVLNDSLSVAAWRDMKVASVYVGAVEKHLEFIRQSFANDFKIKVVVDCGCGAASVITPYLLQRLGCEVTTLNSHPNGIFPHPVEPVEENLVELMRATRELDADLGIAHDGDADRAMAVDDKGRFVSGDKLLALFAQHTMAKEIVTTVDASMTIDEMGFKVTRTPVGDIHVSEALKKGGSFGGEPSGAWVFPSSSLCPDGIYAAASLVAIASGQKLSNLADSIPSYPLIRGSVLNEGRTLLEMERRLLTMRPQSTNKIDGLRMNFEDGWLLVRASGTEPRIRITAEAKTEQRVRQLYDAGVNIINEYLKADKEK